MLVQTDWLQTGETRLPLAAAWIPEAELKARPYELNPQWVPRFTYGKDPGDPGPANEGDIYRLWRPERYIAELLDDRTPGRVLDLGCGQGRDAVYLADRGWQVTAIDHLPDAIDRARLLQERYAPDTDIDWRIGDYADVDFAGFDVLLSVLASTRDHISRLLPGQEFIGVYFRPWQDKDPRMSLPELDGFRVLDRRPRNRHELVHLVGVP